MRRLLSCSSICLLTLLACHNGESSSEPTDTGAEPEAGEAETMVIPAAPPGVALERRNHAAPITEVMLDPEARAALTLDRDGGVRLWTSLAGVDQPPLRLPLDDPKELSLARAADGSFVIAALDTVGAAEVYELREREGVPYFDLLFRVGPTDPLFELHALAGGERLLALGIDHRVRLYDRSGTERASLSEPGFVPWQLRQVQRPAAGGQGPAEIDAVAVLAGPTRVQRLEVDLAHDRLARVGEAYAVDLDRGPNRNDLALSPDGQRVAVLRRPKRRSDIWNLGLLSLADGSVTHYAGRSGVERTRPRMHLVSAEQALLDDGTGVAQLVDIRAEAGIEPSRDDELDPDEQVHGSRPLAGLGARLRLHSSVVRGTRVVPKGDHFIVEELGGEDYQRFGQREAKIAAAGLRPDGGAVVWASSEGWGVEELDAAGAGAAGAGHRPMSRSPYTEAEFEPYFADFVDAERIVLVGADGEVELRAAVGGAVLGTDAEPRKPDCVLLARGEQPRLWLRLGSEQTELLLGVGEDGLRERQRLSVEGALAGPWLGTEFTRPWSSMRTGRVGWGSAGPAEDELEDKLGEDLMIVAYGPASAGYAVVWGEVVELVRTEGGGEHFGTVAARSELAVGRGGVALLSPSPKGDKLALVYNRGIVAVHDAMTLEREWARALPVRTLSWSEDGERFAVALDSAGGAVLDAASGELVLERRDFGVLAETHDAPELPEPDAGATTP